LLSNGDLPLRTRVLADSQISRPLKIDPKMVSFTKKNIFAVVKCLAAAVCINKELENYLGKRCLG